MSRLGSTTECEPARAAVTLRDYFATNAPAVEVQQLGFMNLSRMAQERITGKKYPVHAAHATTENVVAFQLAEIEFQCAVNAAIRYLLADAMIKERARR